MPGYLIVFLFINAGLALLLALNISRLTRTPGTRALILLCTATAFWSAGYAFELSSSNLEAILFWAKVQYIGIVIIPVAWFLFSFSYANPARRFSFLQGRFLSLWIIPALTLILVLTNSLHNLIWSVISFVQVGSLSTLSIGYGPWFWVHLAYSYLLLLAGSIMLVNVLVNSVGLLRWQTGLVLIAIAIPWVSNILYISSPGLLPGLDFTPFAFFISCLLFFISLYQFSLGSSQPIPRTMMVESMSDGVLMLDPQGKILDLNASARAIIGGKGLKLIGQDFTRLFPETQSLIAPATLAESKTTLTIKVGGERQNYQMVVSPLGSMGSDQQNKLVILHRIEHMAPATSPNGAIDRIQEIVELEPDAMLLVNRQRQIILVNSQAEQLFGYERDELCQLPLDALVPERYRHQHQGNVAGFFKNPETRSMGTPLSLFAQKKDGSEFPVDISLSPLTTGAELLVACAIRDMSAHRKIEQSLRESEETYRALFEHANDAIFLLSLEGVHLRVNQKAVDLLGYTREELTGKSMVDVVVPEEYTNAQDRLSHLLSGETSPLYERTFRKKDGSTLSVEINLSLIRNDVGQPTMIQSVVRDISERKRIQQEQLRLLAEIQQSQQELRALEAHLLQVVEEERRALAAELHDRVGQSLTGLNLNLNIISSQFSQYNDTEIQSRLEDSIELVEETTRLVRNVMADLHPPMLDEYGLFSALRWYCDKNSQRTNIQVSMKGEECQPRLPASVELVLFRIVQEAMNNINKHARADQVTVMLESNPKTAILHIADNGAGFNLEIQNKTEQEDHWGLINMKERARSVDGKFTIQTAPGQGTNISIEIPRQVRDD